LPFHASIASGLPHPRQIN